MLIQFKVKMKLTVVTITVFICPKNQEFLDCIFDQKEIAKDTHDLNSRPIHVEVVFNNSDQTVLDDVMYMDPDCIFRFTSKGLYTKMLLDSLKKQLNLPSVAVKKGNFFCFEVEVVSIEDKGQTKIRGIEFDTPERNRIGSTVSVPCESNRLIPQFIVFSFKHAFTFSDFLIIMKRLPYDKDRFIFLNCVEPREVKISSIKHIASVPFVYKPPHGLGITGISMADCVENRYFSGNINMRVNLNAELCASELCPSKDRHPQVDVSGINGIEPSVEFKVFGDAFSLGNRHHVKGKLFKDSRVLEAVSIGKFASFDGNLSKSKVKRSFSMSNIGISEFSRL